MNGLPKQCPSCGGSCGTTPCSYGKATKTGKMGDKQIDKMVNRFLGWRLPDDFAPDSGVSFTPHPHPNSWPVGTNLLDVDQARQMIEFMLDENT